MVRGNNTTQCIAAVHHGNCQLFVIIHDNTMMTRKLMTDEFPDGGQMDRGRVYV